MRMAKPCRCNECYLKSLGIRVFDADAPPADVDESRMTATGVLCTSARDRDGDIIEVGGIDVSNHRLNPVVLLEHGVFYPLPIGRTVDPDGNYTVRVGENEVVQTTYFSQHSEVAEQVFRLLSEGTLTGNSIGFRPIEERPLTPDPAKGFRRGKHILRCELLEATWTGLPANPECVTSILEAGVIGGKAIAPALKTMLNPYKLPRKAWAPGARMNKDYEPMSAVDEAHGGALRSKDDDLPEEDMKDERQEPLGASTMRDLHEDMKDIVASYEDTLPKIEHQEVKKHIEKCMGAMRKHIEGIQDAFKKHYPDAEPLDEIKSEGEEDEVAEGDEVSGEGGSDRDVEGDEYERKSVRDLLARAMKVLEGTVAEEDVSDDDPRLRRLERSLARREKLLQRISVGDN